MTTHTYSILEKYRRGYALLLVLLAIAIVGAIYVFQFSFGSVHEIGKEGESEIEPPWRQWDKLYKQVELKEQPLGELRPLHPELPENLFFEGHCMRNGERCGKIAINVSNDKSVNASWGGEFRVTKDVEFQVMACQLSKGMIDPDHVYEKNGVKDPSKLFFICKGNFSIVEYNYDNSRTRHIGGEAYVRGWLDPEHNVDGDLIISSDHKNFYRYTFAGKMEEGYGFLDASPLQKLR